MRTIIIVLAVTLSLLYVGQNLITSGESSFASHNAALEAVNE